MKFNEIEIVQKEYTGYEKIKKCILKTEEELRDSSNFYPEMFFDPKKYQFLELDLVQYKNLFGLDRNIK